LGGALKQDWIRKEGAYLVASKTDIQDTTKQLLETILQTKTLSDVKTLNELRKRKLVRLEKAISYTITKGPKYAKEMPIEHADLTADLLASGAWQVRCRWRILKEPH
jgi:phenylalanyl-tRNA synthetase alpha chain